MQVKLMSRGVVVSVLSIPDFKPPPDVLVWGDRTFRRYHARAADEAVPHYTEAFAYYVPEITAGKEPGLSITG